ncbi:MAG: VWA domain-containing protein [Phycisphaerae bacterium]|nr:VWA domain-containing protein [Phycisphaerae bacterium]
MIFSDYPGHLIAVGMLVFFAAILFFMYRSEHISGAKKWVPVLYLLRFSAIVLLLFIIWNPSRPQSVKQSVRNSVLVFFDTSESMSAEEDSKMNRLEESAKLFEQAFNPAETEGPEYDILGFDRFCYNASNIESLKKWGKKTNFHDVVATLSRQTLAVPEESGSGDMSISPKVVGAVIFSDGQADDKDPQAYLPLNNKDLPIAVIGVGSRKNQPDLAVTSISSPVRVILDTAYHVQAEIGVKYFKGKPVTVELLKDDYPISKKQILADELTDKATVNFAVGADTLGRHTLSVRVVGDAKEINLANNVRRRDIEVTGSDKVKVFLYSQVAHPCIGKLRQALSRDKKVELDFSMDVVISSTVANKARNNIGYRPLPKNRKEFFEYDVIILGPCSMDLFTRDQIDGLYGFVVDRGGGLVILPGIGRFGPLDWNSKTLRTLLPVMFKSGLTSALLSGKPGPVRLTTEGLDSNVITEAALGKYPGSITPYYNDIAKKPATAMFATVGDNPFLCTERIGKGRVCFINTLQLSRWYREDLDGGLLQEFMASVTSHVLPAENIQSSVKVFANRPDQRPDIVQFQACVYDNTFSYVSGATVLLDIEGEVIKMSPSKEGHYVADVADITEESIVATVQAQRGGVFFGKKTITVDLPMPQTEMDNIDLDRKFLKDFADRINGKYYDTYNVENMASMFQAKTEGETYSHMISVWPGWTLLGVLCIVLTLCWFIRRSVGLV